MRNKKTTYKVYAGYYEVYVTTHVLRRPFTLISTHRKLSTALRAAEKHDVSVIYDTALRNQVATHYDTTPEQLQGLNFFNDNEQLQWMHFFDGKEQSIDNGLAEITLDNLNRELNVQPCAADALDMANYMAHREKISHRKALALIEGLTYAQLKPMFA